MKQAFLGSLVVLLTAVTCLTRAGTDETLQAALRFIQEITHEKSIGDYSGFWYKAVREHVLASPEQLKREYAASARVHSLLIRHGGLEQPPHKLVTPAGDITYTFPLTRPIIVLQPDEVALLFPGRTYREYQITLVAEQGQWKVAGETFVGEENSPGVPAS